MDKLNPEQLEDALRRDGRYAPEAYQFLHHGLVYATKMVYGDDPPAGTRHISGAQLSEGLRRLAIQQWGPLAREVLERWGVRSTRDFGEMVFVLVGLNVLGKQDSDKLEDFDDVYNFAQAFSQYDIVLDCVEE